MNDETINQNGGQEASSGQIQPKTIDAIDELETAYKQRLHEIEVRLTLLARSGYSFELQEEIAHNKMRLENLKLGLDALVELLRHEGKQV